MEDSRRIVSQSNDVIEERLSLIPAGSYGRPKPFPATASNLPGMEKLHTQPQSRLGMIPFSDPALAIPAHSLELKSLDARRMTACHVLQKLLVTSSVGHFGLQSLSSSCNDKSQKGC